MSREPTRWLESTQRPELLSLMRVGADELAPPEVLARVGERLRQSSLASEPSVSLAAVHPSSPRPTSGFRPKVVGTALLLLGLTLGLYLTLRSRPEAPVHQSVSAARQRSLPPDTEPLAPAPLAPEASATPEAAADGAVSAAVTPAVETEGAGQTKRLRRLSRERPEKPSAQPVDTRLLEARLLEQARKALSARPDHALALLHDHETQFPASWLEEERAALVIRALVATGRRPEARTRLTSFEARFPGSLHTERLARALAEP